jgi:hypothetical protein
VNLFKSPSFLWFLKNTREWGLTELEFSFVPGTDDFLNVLTLNILAKKLAFLTKN